MNLQFFKSLTWQYICIAYEIILAFLIIGLMVSQKKQDLQAFYLTQFFMVIVFATGRIYLAYKQYKDPNGTFLQAWRKFKYEALRVTNNIIDIFLMSCVWDAWSYVYDIDNFFQAVTATLMIGNIMFWSVIMCPYLIYKHCFKAEPTDGIRELDKFDLEWSQEAGDLYGPVDEARQQEHNNYEIVPEARINSLPLPLKKDVAPVMPPLISNELPSKQERQAIIMGIVNNSRQFDPRFDHLKECNICSEQFKARDTVSPLPCNYNHYFHTSCVKDWVKHKLYCPMCRRQFTAQHFVNLGGNREGSHSKLIQH